MLKAHVEKLLGPDATNAGRLAELMRGADVSLREAAIVAAGFLGDRTLAEAVAERLAAPGADERMQAAITLGVLEARSFAPQIAARLEVERDRAFSAMVAALEMLSAREVVPQIVEVLRVAPEAKVWDLTHGLWVITGVDPADPRATSTRDADALEALRVAWLRAADSGLLDAPPPPQISSVRELSRGMAQFALAFGRGQVCFDFEPPSPGATWPRWSQSLYVGDDRLYDLGSTCGTCELYLRHLGWPPALVAATATTLEVADARRGLGDWISQWAPLLEQLRSGHYLVARIALPVERIDRNNLAESWFHRRLQIRAAMSGEQEEDDAEPPYWPGTAHYQGPRVGSVPVYPVVFPAQDLGALDEARVVAYHAEISGGARPAVVALGWLDARSVRGEHEERFLPLVVLNGHHRIEAYARARVAAPIVVVARIADSWGPPEAPDRWLREALAPFAS